MSQPIAATRDDAQQAAPQDDRQRHRALCAGVGLGASLFEELAFLPGLIRADDCAHLVHVGFADVRRHELERGVEPLGLAQIDRLLQLGQLRRSAATWIAASCLLTAGLSAVSLLQLVEAGLDRCRAPLDRARDSLSSPVMMIAALAGLGILASRDSSSRRLARTS